MLKNNQRNCPSCNTILTYANKYGVKHAEEKGAICRSCKGKSVENVERLKKFPPHWNNTIDNKKDKIIKLYDSGKTLNFIAEKMSCSVPALRNHFKKWGYKARCCGYKLKENPDIASKQSKRYKCNTKFFSKPNNLNSYWAGFVASDGNITEDRSVRIELAMKDISHLEELKSILKFTGNVKIYKTKKVKNPYCRLEIFEKKICEDLEKYWRITPRKTFTLELPNLNIKNTLSYIAGYIDGDGSIQKERHCYHISCMGNYKFLSNMKIFLEKFLKEKGAVKIYKNKSIWVLRIFRKHCVLKLANYIYKLHLPVLDRKWNNLFKEVTRKIKNVL